MNDHTLAALRFDRRVIELEARRIVAATAADMLRTTDRSAAEIAGTWHTNANHYSTKADNYARQPESRRFIESSAAAAEWRRLAVEVINQPLPTQEISTDATLQPAAA